MENIQKHIRSVLKQISLAVEDMIDSLEKIYFRAQLSLNLDKSQIHKIVMSIVAPIQLSIDQGLKQSPHFQITRKDPMANAPLTLVLEQERNKLKFFRKLYPNKGYRNFKNSALGGLEEEEELRDWVIKLKEEGKKILKWQFKVKALEISKKSEEEFMASEGWMKNFLIRFGILDHIEEYKYLAKKMETNPKFKKKVIKKEDESDDKKEVGNLNELFKVAYESSVQNESDVCGEEGEEGEEGKDVDADIEESGMEEGEQP